jgi:hypothetical protein
MFTLFLALASGTLLGVVLRRRSRLLTASNHIMSLSILALLFLLGLSVGANEDITHSLDRLGLEALVLSLAGTGGSVLLAYLLYRRLYREK